MRALFGLLLAVGIAGCSSTPVERAAPTAPLAAQPPPAASSATVAAPSAAPSVDAPPQPLKLELELIGGGKGVGAQRLFVVDDKLVVADKGEISVLEGDKPKRLGTLPLKGIDVGDIIDIDGVVPGMLFVSWRYYIGRASAGMDAAIFRLKNQHFEVVVKNEQVDPYGANLSLVLLKDESLAMLTQLGEFELLHGRGQAFESPPMDAMKYASSIVHLPSGDVAALSWGNKKLYRWKAGTAAPLPPITTGTEDRAGFLRVSRSGEVLVVNDRELRRLEGDQLKPIATLPITQPIFDAALATDGTLWASTEASLFRHKDGAWNVVDLPQGTRISDIEIAPNGRLYLVLNERLLGLGGASGEWRETIASTPVPKRVTYATAATKDCKTNVVVLYGFTKVTPDDYDFPLTRKALKGHGKLGSDVRLAVTRELGQRYFVGMTPDFAKAQELAKIVAAGVKGSKPQVVCATPEVVREVAIDWATGDVKR
jgi:hypothetical protein